MAPPNYLPHELETVYSWLESNRGLSQPQVVDLRGIEISVNLEGPGTHTGAHLSIMKAIVGNEEWTEIVMDVKAPLEEAISDTSSKRKTVHNVVFACEEGREKSVAAAAMFESMLGTQPGRA